MKFQEKTGNYLKSNNTTSKIMNNFIIALIPILIKRNLNDINSLKKSKCTECIECGLCSYICPAKIELREYVKEAKNKFRTEAK